LRFSRYFTELRPLTLAWPSAGLVIGLILQGSGSPLFAGLISAIATIPVLGVLVAEVITE
jgi:hypothetical protein